MGAVRFEEKAFYATAGRAKGEDSSWEDPGCIAEELIRRVDVIDEILEVTMLDCSVFAVHYE
jgi:hypothetical protein